MTNRRLYTVTIPVDALRPNTGQANQRQEVAKLTGLSGDGSVTSVGSNPGEFRVEGQFRGTGAEMMAREVSELGASEAISSVAFYDAEQSVSSAGYYTVEQIQNRRFRPQRPEVASFSVRLAREGTRDSHRRYLQTNRRQVTNDWGSDATERLGVPSTATKVTWISEDQSKTQPATAAGSVPAEFGTVDLYDPTTVSGYGSPGLVYQLPYDGSGDVDVAVFDTYDRGEFALDGNFSWQQVFQASHEFEGAVVVENGVVRVTFDESDNSITAEEWDDGTDAWADRALGAAGGWQVVDVDLIEAEPSRLWLQAAFEDTDDGSRYRLDVFLFRGWENLLFAVTQSGSGPVPADLVTYLDPIASPRYTDAKCEKRLLDREELRE